MAKYRVVISERFHIDWEDLKKFFKNQAIFFSPVILVALAALKDLVPVEWQYAALCLWAINGLIDLFRKWVNKNTYLVK